MVQESTHEEITPLVSDFASTSLVKEEAHKLDVKIEQTKNDLVKYMLSIFITLVIMILGLYAAILFRK